MANGIIALRPHHIDGFVGYYHKFTNMFDNSIHPPNYGEEFSVKLKELYEHIASGGNGKEYILVKNGLDSICSMCPIKKESCSEPDSLSIWNGSGEVMQRMHLKEGWLYPLEKFMKKVKKLYPNRNPNIIK